MGRCCLIFAFLFLKHSPFLPNSSCYSGSWWPSYAYEFLQNPGQVPPPFPSPSPMLSISSLLVFYRQAYLSESRHFSVQYSKMTLLGAGLGGIHPYHHPSSWKEEVVELCGFEVSLVYIEF